jgi:hypothetical protein
VRILDNNSRAARRLGKAVSEWSLSSETSRDAETVQRAVEGLTQCTTSLSEWHRQLLQIKEVDACDMNGVGELIAASSSEVHQTAPQVPTDETPP